MSVRDTAKYMTRAARSGTTVADFMKVCEVARAFDVPPHLVDTRIGPPWWRRLRIAYLRWRNT